MRDLGTWLASAVLCAGLVGPAVAQPAAYEGGFAQGKPNVGQEPPKTPRAPAVSPGPNQGAPMQQPEQLPPPLPFDSFLRFVGLNSDGPAPAPSRVTRPELLGDLPPLGSFVDGPNGKIYLPTARGFKMGDNQSPMPQDRTFFNFNYFNNLYVDINRRLGGDLQSLQVTRENFGIERVFLDGCASFAVTFPIYTVSSRGTLPDLNASDVQPGDLTFIFKHICWEEDFCACSQLISAGLAATAPLGPDALVAADRYAVRHNPSLQPFVGYLWEYDRWYFQGFMSVDVPMNINASTLLFNDLGLRYLLYENPNRFSFLTSITPTAEVHVTTPFNHRGINGGGDSGGTPDMVNITAAVEVLLFGRLRLTTGVVTPVVGPAPLGYEAITQVRVIY